ncbi:MAG TPA: diacylglycerol kinase [Mycobacteriales bacterium]|nr:diacylglycerol kinase [Mycobacteriales bacterium]
MQIALVANPTAGKGAGRAAAEVAVARLRELGVIVEQLAGRDGEEALDLCRRAVAGGVDALVALGGDGMAHLALQAVAGTPTALGIVASGTGNDLAAHLGLPIRDPRAAADVIAAGHVRQVDSVRLTPGDRWFGCVLGAGFDSVVNERANQMRWPKGPQRYNLAIAAELPRFRPLPFRLTLDGEGWETDAMLVAVGNATSYGAGMKVTPDAVIDDGLLDVCVLGPVSKVEFVRTFPRVFKGTHVTHPAVTVRRARSVTLEAPGVVAYADGERIGPLPLTCECIPGATRMLVPGADASQS